jgi:hypothetical protein
LVSATRILKFKIYQVVNQHFGFRNEEESKQSWHQNRSFKEKKRQNKQFFSQSQKSPKIGMEYTATKAP